MKRLVPYYILTAILATMMVVFLGVIRPAAAASGGGGVAASPSLVLSADCQVITAIVTGNGGNAPFIGIIGIGHNGPTAQVSVAPGESQTFTFPVNGLSGETVMVTVGTSFKGGGENVTIPDCPQSELAFTGPSALTPWLLAFAAITLAMGGIVLGWATKLNPVIK